MGIFEAGVLERGYTNMTGMIQHGMALSEQILFKEAAMGNLQRGRAFATRAGNALTGFSKGGGSAFANMLDHTESVSVFKASRAKNPYHAIMGGSEQTSMWHAKGKMLGHMANNWWSGRDLMSTATTGGGARTSTMRQAIAYGGAAMIGKSMLFDRHKRRSY